MSNVTNDTQFCEAGMYAWNTLSCLLETDEAKPFDNVEEFKEFYNLVIDRLFEEEVEA